MKEHLLKSILYIEFRLFSLRQRDGLEFAVTSSTGEKGLLSSVGMFIKDTPYLVN